MISANGPNLEHAVSVTEAIMSKYCNCKKGLSGQPRSQGVLTSYAHHEAEGTPWYTSMKCAQNLGAFGSHYGFHRWLGNAKRWKMAVALVLILQKMNGEIENKYFKDLI